jgi:hypothetical protein
MLGNWRRGLGKGRGLYGGGIRGRGKGRSKGRGMPRLR